MKIAVSATADNLDAMVDPRFGRCAYFMILEVKNKKIKDSEAIQNTGAQARGGAGISAAQLVANKGVQVVISGNMGPNAFGVLSQNDIKIVTGVGGITVKEAVQRYLNGELKETSAPTTPGFGPSRSMSGRRGAGRRMGRGSGMGRGT